MSKTITFFLMGSVVVVLLFGHPMELRSEDNASDGRFKAGSSKSILVLSDKDLVGQKFSVLGKVSVRSEEEDGFSRDEAIRALKKEALKEYGSEARGILNVSYEENRGMRFWRTVITEASAEVVTWEDQKKAEAPKRILPEPLSSSQPDERIAPPQPLPSPEPNEKAPLPELSRKPHAPMDVKVLSADDLFTMKILFLGNIAVRNNSEEGFPSKEDAVRALKIEAVKKYANQAQGISNIEFQDEMSILHGTKIRSAYADVVTWEPGEEVAATRMARREPAPSAPPVSDEGVEEVRISSYSNRTVRSGQIKMLRSEADSAKYKVLGKVEVTSPTRDGLIKSDIDRELRRKAFQTFGGQAWGIRNITYEIAQCFKCEGKFKSASGEVVTR